MINSMFTKALNGINGKFPTLSATMNSSYDSMKKQAGGLKGLYGTHRKAGTGRVSSAMHTAKAGYNGLNSAGKSAVAGAGLGMGYGAVSDDTSMFGGAMMGAIGGGVGMGAVNKYLGGTTNVKAAGSMAWNAAKSAPGKAYSAGMSKYASYAGGK